jgi:hypothetical protein
LFPLPCIDTIANLVVVTTANHSKIFQNTS